MSTERTVRHVGIDVSKEHLDVCSLPDGEIFSVANDRAGIDELLARLLEGVRPDLVVLEATGKYERPAAVAVAAAGIAVAVVNPRQARDFAKAAGRLAKTERIDAEVLARFAGAVGPRPSVLPDEEARALQDILVRRRQLLEMIVAEKNRLQMASEAVAKNAYSRSRAVAGEGARPRRQRARRSGTGKRDLPRQRGTAPQRARSRSGLGPHAPRRALPELGTLPRRRLCALVGGWRRSTATPEG